MSRRLVAAVAVLVVLVLVPAGALSGVFASETTGSGLVIDAAAGPNGDYADLSNDELALDFSGGVSDNAINRFDAVFTVTNDRTYEAPVWINDSSDAIGFYDTDTGASVEGRENGVSLAPGETLVVGVSVDTREASVSEVESTDNFSIETLVEEATATPTETATPTSTATATSDSATSSSGGGGGGQTGDATESSYQVYDTDEGATIRVREGVPSDPIDADLVQDGTAYASGAGTTVDAVEMDLTFERENWRVEMTTPTDSPQNAPAVSAGEAVSYTRLDAYGVEAAAFDSIAVNLTVSDLPAGTDPSQVTVYRHTADGWQPVETTHLGGDQYRAETGGFGELAVVVESDGGSGTGGSGTSTTETNPNVDGTATATGTETGTATGTGTETSLADPVTTPTATDSEVVEQPVRLDNGLGTPTLFVFAAFTTWLAVRAEYRRGGGL